MSQSFPTEPKVSLKQKLHFYLLIAAGALILASVFLIPFKTGTNSKEQLASEPQLYRDLTSIKPFTSLAGFNWKFGKPSKQKQKETKHAAFSLLLIHF